MNVGGDPGQDDYGLPPVDIEIPEDARELDRDVQAYYRELRAQRRRRRLQAVQAPFARDGMVLPLLAGCLALTLFAGTLLTVLSGGQQPFTPIPQATSAHTSQKASSPAVGGAPGPGSVGGPLPDVVVVAGGQKTDLRSLAASVLALVPPACGCRRALRLLTARAASAGAQVYVVGVNGARVGALTRQVGLRSSHAVEDTSDVLAAYYHPVGLTAVFVRADGTVGDVLPARRQDAALLRALAGMAPAPSPQAT